MRWPLRVRRLGQALLCPMRRPLRMRRPPWPARAVAATQATAAKDKLQVRQAITVSNPAMHVGKCLFAGATACVKGLSSEAHQENLAVIVVFEYAFYGCVSVVIRSVSVSVGFITYKCLVVS